MEEEEVRLSLLQTELNSIQGSITRLDSRIFQVKGWCVTTSLAVGGFAIAYHKPALLFVGWVATISFFMVNCQFKMYQRSFIDRNRAIDSELRDPGIMQVLKGAGNFEIVGTGLWVSRASNRDRSIPQKIRSGLPRFWLEAHMVNTFSLYLLISLCLMIEGIVLVVLALWLFCGRLGTRGGTFPLYLSLEAKDALKRSRDLVRQPHFAS